MKLDNLIDKEDDEWEPSSEEHEEDIPLGMMDSYLSIKKKVNEFTIELAQYVWEHSSKNPANYDVEDPKFNTLLVWDENDRDLHYPHVGRITDTTYRLAAAVVKSGDAFHKEPRTVAAGCVYASMLLNNFKVTQSHMSDVTGVSHAAIRERYQDAMEADPKFET